MAEGAGRTPEMSDVTRLLEAAHRGGPAVASISASCRLGISTPIEVSCVMPQTEVGLPSGRR
jgi:hypothetical protein